MRSNNVNMLSGPITKGLLALSIPVMVMNVMQNMFGIIDMTVLRFFSDDTAVGAVGACAYLLVLSTSLMIGIAVGVNVIVARRIGEGDKKQADAATVTSIILSVAGGVLLMVVGMIFARTFLVMTNCPDSLLDAATIYFKIYFAGVPLMMIYNFCSAILRAAGDTKRPMYFLLLGGAVKIIFTIIFVSVFDMDVAGVAYSTVISNLISGGLSLYAVIKRDSGINIDIKNMRVDFKELKAILFVGIPAGLQQVAYSFANVVIAVVVNGFGADATTGVSIANQYDGILYQISCAPAIAVVPYISQNVGAGNIKRAKQALVRAIMITVGFGATFGVLSAIFAGPLSSVMSSTPAVIAFSRQKMIIVSSTYFICGINEVMCGALRGIGKPIIPTVATLIFMCLLRFVWIYTVYPLCPNLTFLYTVWPVGWILSIITLLMFYIPGIKKPQEA